MNEIRFFFEEDSQHWHVYFKENDEEWLVAYIHISGDAVFLDIADKNNPIIAKAVYQKQYELLQQDLSKPVKNSKFISERFQGTYCFGVSSLRYDRQQAMALFIGEFGVEIGTTIVIREAFATHHPGISEDNTPLVTWWLEEKTPKRGCPIWAFSFDEHANGTKIVV